MKVSAGTVKGIVAGGLSSDGNAIGNSVEIEGGTFGGGYYTIAVAGGISAADPFSIHFSWSLRLCRNSCTVCNKLFQTFVNILVK